MTDQNTLLAEALTKKFGADSLQISEFRDELTVVLPVESIVEVCRFLKSEPGLEFNYLMDLAGIDMATESKRFGVIYNLYSLKFKHRIRLKVFVEEQLPHVPTMTGVWGTANWHEREAFDMFGLVFDGHPDLRRMYMPEEYEHFPLRKDFPLMGIPGSLSLPKK